LFAPGGLCNAINYVIKCIFFVLACTLCTLWVIHSFIKETQFAAAAEDLNELKNEDGNEVERDNDGGYDSYVNQGISTNESKNQQRRANLLSHAKLENKGIILEAVLWRNPQKMGSKPIV